MNWSSWKHWATITLLPIGAVGLNAFVQAFTASGGALTTAALESDAKVAAGVLLGALVGLVQPNKAQQVGP